jgi:hypothetical protein
MKEGARPRGRWRPALLSGLVFPGLGQLTSGRTWRGLFFSGSTAALLAAVVVRVMRETQRLLPTDPDALLDPALPFRLAMEIHRANASFFLWATLGVVALWVGSVFDACLLRDSVGPIPKEPDQSRHPSGPPSTRGPEG